MLHPAELPHRIGVLLHAADELHEGRVGLDALHGAWRSQLARVCLCQPHTCTRGASSRVARQAARWLSRWRHSSCTCTRLLPALLTPASGELDRWLCPY